MVLTPELLAALTKQITEQVTASLSDRLPPAPAPRPEEVPVDPDIPVWEFWSAGPNHCPRLKRPGGGFIHFRNGYFRATTETDAYLIRTHLRGQVWEKDWPDGRERPRDPRTGWSPGSVEAWMAFQRYSVPIPHASQ